MTESHRSPSGVGHIAADVERAFMVCYEKQMQALEAIGLTVASGRSQSTLLFGLPGNGRMFALSATLDHIVRDHDKAIASYNHYTAAFLLRIVQSLDTRFADPFDHVLRTSMLAKRPTMICFEEIDAISHGPILLEEARSLRSESDFSSYSVLTSQFVSLLDKLMKVNKIWIVGIANSPGECDPAIIQRFRIPIFFGIPNLKGMEAIISNTLKARRSKAVARLLFRKTSEFGIYLSMNSIVNACREIHKERKALDDLSDDDMVSRILASYGSGIAAESVRRYERTNSGFINVCLNETLPFWSKELKRFEGT